MGLISNDWSGDGSCDCLTGGDYRVFSMVNQAIQLRYLPRLSVKHTSAEERGQIYLPFINWMLFISVVILILLFENSARLASAYGVAVTMTMLCGTILISILAYGFGAGQSGK